MRRARYMLLGALGCAIACSDRVDPERPVRVVSQPIVGGYAVQSCQGADTVSIGNCGATLIHSQVLVTAAHCLNGEPQVASFGDSLTNSQLAVPIARCVAHPDYRLVSGMDIGVCLLAQPVDIPYVPVIAACEAQAAIVPGGEVTLIGYGDLGALESGDGTKHFVDVPIQDRRAEGRELLVGDSARGACYGDSGASAYVRLADGSSRFVGVISRRGDAYADELDAACATSTILSLAQPHSAWIASVAGMDIDPCHDENRWNPGQDCGVFARDPLQTGPWEQACGAADAEALAPTCVASDSRAHSGSCSLTRPTSPNSSLKGFGLTLVAMLWLRRRHSRRTVAGSYSLRQR